MRDNAAGGRFEQRRAPLLESQKSTPLPATLDSTQLCSEKKHELPVRNACPSSRLPMETGRDPSSPSSACLARRWSKSGLRPSAVPIVSRRELRVGLASGHGFYASLRWQSLSLVLLATIVPASMAMLTPWQYGREIAD